MQPPRAPVQRHDIDAPRGTIWLYGIHAIGAALQNPQRRLRRLLLTEEAEAALAATAAAAAELCTIAAEAAQILSLAASNSSRVASPLANLRLVSTQSLTDVSPGLLASKTGIVRFSSRFLV